MKNTIEKTVISNRIPVNIASSFKLKAKKSGHKMGWVIEKLLAYYNRNGLPLEIQPVKE